jgi:hypothetical protein
VRTRFLLVAWAALAAACYSTPQPNCAFRCGGTSEDCPSGYMCNPSDNICHLVVGDTLAECEVVVTPDAETAIDGRPLPDAVQVHQFDAPSTGGEPDAPIVVGEPDAPIGEPDAPPSVPDAASHPDAPSAPDAAAPAIDARPAVDANVSDA